MVVVQAYVDGVWIEVYRSRYFYCAFYQAYIGKEWAYDEKLSSCDVRTFYDWSLHNE